MLGNSDPPPTFDLQSDDLRAEIATRGLDITPALEDILATVQGLGASWAVLEPDYIDRDYRDEYVHYYAFTYRPLSTRCSRMHFFKESDDGPDVYLGYCVLRPIRDHPVCRTVITPPDDLRPYVSCMTTSVVHASGQRFGATGFPFMEQDSLYGVCAHASIWMVALYHHLEHRTPRRLMSNIRTGAAARQEFFRVTPSDGLSERQVGAALQHLGLDAIQYSLDRLKKLGPGTTAATICRYLNSRFPVILTTANHVTILIGYGRDPDGTLFFVQTDESNGPYNRYELADLVNSWRLLLVPVPGKIYLSGESAEVKAQTFFVNLVNDELPPERHILKEALRLKVIRDSGWRLQDTDGGARARHVAA